MTSETSEQLFDLVLQSGMVVKGDGTPPASADIAINGAHIAKIGSAGTLRGRKTIDVSGQTVVPGFIDIHSHGDYTVLLDGRAHSAVLQGITSVVVGNCGHGIAPVTPTSLALTAGNAAGWRHDTGVPITWRSFGEYMELLRSRGVGPNIYPLVAHGAMRLAVAGFEDRSLTEAEIDEMKSFLRDAMEDGAVGFSTGLEYAPGISSTREELVALAEAMRGANGLYATHCRNRSDKMVDAAEEAIAIAKSGEARLQMSHFIKRPYADPEQARKAWASIENARAAGLTVCADVFPFDYGPTPLSVLIPPALRAEGGADLASLLREPDFKARVLAGLDGMFGAAVENGLADRMYVASDGADGKFVGSTLPEVAEANGIGVAEAAYWLLENAGENYESVMIVENWVLWEDLVGALSDPNFLIMGDGATGVLDGPGSKFDMSLSDWGYAPRFLSQFVRDMKVCSIEDAVERMSTGPARQLGLVDRGRLAEGLAADITVFNMRGIGTNVSPRSLREIPTGISQVLVNGTLVVHNGAPTDALPGCVGRKAA